MKKKSKKNNIEGMEFDMRQFTRVNFTRNDKRLFNEILKKYKNSTRLTRMLKNMFDKNGYKVNGRR